MKITVETNVKADLNAVWIAWNAASDDWHTTHCTVDLREGGKMSSRMEAKDGSAGFDFEGTYTRIVPQKLIEYTLGDGRDVKVEFTEADGGVLVKETFETESENEEEFQRRGWQAILNHFARHVESKGRARTAGHQA